MKLFRRRPGPVERVLAKHDAAEEDIRRRDGIAAVAAAGRRAWTDTHPPEDGPVCIRSEPKVAHLLIGGRTACEDMSLWPVTVWDLSPEGRERAKGLRLHSRCQAAGGQAS
jgi:hypothetical protein